VALDDEPHIGEHKGLGLREIAAGLFILVIGVAVWIASFDLNFGTPQRMGSGFLPFWLGVLMGVCGIMIAASGLRGGEPFPAFPTFRPLLALLLGFAAFAFLVGPWGLIAAAFAGVAVSSFAIPKPNILHTILFAALLAVSAALLFVVLLEVPINIWPRQ
jgi:hypothetical protein